VLADRWQALSGQGVILKVELGRWLVHTHWSPGSLLPDSPENYQEVTSDLSDRDGTTQLSIGEVNLPSEEPTGVVREHDDGRRQAARPISRSRRWSRPP
jgi:hypothetical protein